MFNYLKDFISNLSSIVKPLRELLKKDISWIRHLEALNNLKTLIIISLTLGYFDKKNYNTTVQYIQK